MGVIGMITGVEAKLHTWGRCQDEKQACRAPRVLFLFMSSKIP